MLRLIKTQIKELLHTLITAEAEIKTVIEGKKGDGLVNLLADAQEAAVAIGSKIEEADKTGAGQGAIPLLERYCELLWRITQEQNAQRQLQLTEEAWGILGQAGQKLEQIPQQLTMVFLPYKASMWDCMESVWQAACEDPDCVPFVVPIPYFDLKDGEAVARHYEGDKFPAYVPVMDYNGFPLEELHPDAIFIHNPFDDCNTVTSVLPQYYSAALKKVTDKLIYIPYFVTGDSVSVIHRYLPAYENMDYIVVQSERTIASFSSNLPREKFLPFGSTIADRVLRLEAEKPPIPEEWKPQLKNGKDFGGDRVVMLNSSISMLMKARERCLDKIEYLFDMAREKKGISLVWRPHPLLYASARSMGEEYAARVSRLEERFLGEKIGVLDKNPDVGVTVALCDAYLGETASSVIQMFGIAGKPRFYTNLQIPKRDPGGNLTERHGGAGGRNVVASAWCQAGEKEYYVLEESGWIVEREARAEEFKLVVRIPGWDLVWGRAYRRMEMKGERLWVYPENAEGIFIYDTRTGRMWKRFAADGDASPGEGLPLETVEIDDRCLSMIRAEKFRQGNRSYVWYENERSTLDDFFRFLQIAEDDELTTVKGAYAANPDESCGKKVLQAVKESI